MVKKFSLVIVESPGKIKKIKSYLGDGFNVCASFGHIMDLVKGKGNSLGVDIENNYKQTYTVIPDKKDKVKAISDLAKSAECVYICSDPDREGEAIGFHLKECIKTKDVPIKRAIFNEITKSAVQKAIENPVDFDQDKFDAQQGRRGLDRLVGFLATPYLWNSFGRNTSAGRVQSVSLRLLVDREREILSFVPEIYWNINATLAKSLKEIKFVAKYPERILDEEKAKKIKTDLDNSTFVISNVEKSTQLRNPSAPLTTAKLQQNSSSKYKFPTKKTMSIAQSLYESGTISYMRTDSVRVSPEALDAVRSWIVKNNMEVPAKPNVYKEKKGVQAGHECIRPTDVSLTPENFIGDNDQKKIYKLIWEKFVASQMKPAIYDTVSITIKASKGHELKANGRTLKYAGWLEICNEKDDNNEEDVKLPVLVKGDDLVLISPPGVVSEKKQTNPPPRFNEGSLVKELEKRGIGRPSTYATIISKISDRNYASKSKNVFTPTELGCQVVDELSKHFSFMNYDYTAQMEEKLDKIENGELSYLEMMNDFFPPFKEELKKAKTAEEKDGGEDCEKCGKRKKLKHGRFGFYVACENYKECKTSKSVEIKDGQIVPKNPKELVDGVLCPLCGEGMIKRDGKWGPFYGCSLGWPKCKGSRKIPFGVKCKKCDNDMHMTVFKGVAKLACMGYPDCKNIEEIPQGTQVNWAVPPKNKFGQNKKINKLLKK